MVTTELVVVVVSVVVVVGSVVEVVEPSGFADSCSGTEEVGEGRVVEETSTELVVVTLAP